MLELHGPEFLRDLGTARCQHFGIDIDEMSDLRIRRCCEGIHVCHSTAVHAHHSDPEPVIRAFDACITLRRQCSTDYRNRSTGNRLRQKRSSSEHVMTYLSAI